MNEGLTGLERHEGELLMKTFIFGWTIRLNLKSLALYPNTLSKATYVVCKVQILLVLWESNP